MQVLYAEAEGGKGVKTNAYAKVARGVYAWTHVDEGVYARRGAAAVGTCRGMLYQLLLLPMHLVSPRHMIRLT